jgi:hypothetical protein
LFCFEILGRRPTHGLGNGEFSAGTADHILCFGGLQELKAIAESVTLADQGVHFHFSMRQGEFQTNYFVQLELLPQHGGDSGLADVYRVATNDLTVTGIDTNVNFQLETGMTAGVHNFMGGASSELTAAFQSLLPDRRGMRGA